MGQASAQKGTSNGGGKGLSLVGRLTLLLVGTLASVALAEVGTRVLWSTQGRPFSSDSARTEILKASTIMQEGMVAIGEDDDAATDADADGDEPESEGEGEGGANEPAANEQVSNERFLHPYFGWDVDNKHSEYFDQRQAFRKNRSDKVFDVVVLGGSVAASFGWTGRHALLKALSEDPRFEGRPMRLYNHAIAGFKQPQQANRLSYLFTYGYSPDLVINLDGFNEVALGNQNSVHDIHPLHPSGSHWSKLMTGTGGDSLTGPAFDALADLRHYQLDAARQAERALEAGLHRWALSTEVAAWWIRKTRTKGFEAYDRLAEAQTEGELEIPLFGPEYDKRTPKVLELAVEAWANASYSIKGMCDARGIDYLHVLQPTLHDPGSKPLTQSEIDTSSCSREWKNGAEMGYPMLRAAGAELAARGVMFFDASMVFADDPQTLYFDACHFIPEGQVLLAKDIAAFYLSQLSDEPREAPMRSLTTQFIPKQAR